jgi:hypothetical protein
MRREEERKMAPTKIRIDLNAGIVELEGEEAFVSNQLEKLLPILQTAKQEGSNNRDIKAPPDEADVVEPDPAIEVVRKRRKGGNPPKGASCRARILELKKDGFFKSHRSPNDIVAGLKAKGWTHATNQVSAALIMMFNKGEIQRTGADGKFMYFWDRDSGAAE